MVNNFLANLINKNYKIFAPQKTGQFLVIKELTEAKKADYSAKIPANSWKKLFHPASETLFDYQNEKFFESLENYPKTVAWGMNVLDLRALGLFDLVFANDFNYQKRRKNILVVGLSVGAPSEMRDWQVFSHNLEENILEHLPFDVFLEKTKSKDFKIYAGSFRGAELLEKNKITNYEKIEFSGLIPEEGPDQKMFAHKKTMEDKKNSKVWQELGKICIACGKCSLVCPTCFCFDIYDEAVDKNQFKRIRSWASCFYPQFSEIGGGQNFLTTIAQKIHFWYEHKFVRIPGEYKIPGCVSCGRCGEVCPVGIKIKDTFKALENDK